MNFSIFSNRVKIMFLVASVCLFFAIGFFTTYLIVANPVSTYYLVLFIWFGSASTLLFHYLLWQNLPFLQKIDLVRTNNYTITVSLLCYIIFFPIVAFLTLVFLFIFDIAIFILVLLNVINSTKNNNKEKPRQYH